MSFPKGSSISVKHTGQNLPDVQPRTPTSTQSLASYTGAVLQQVCLPHPHPHPHPQHCGCIWCILQPVTIQARICCVVTYVNTLDEINANMKGTNPLALYSR